MLMDLLPLIGGGIFGAVVKLFSMSMENKRRQNEMLISSLQAKQKAINDVNEHAANNEYFAWTRRIIALSVTAMIGALIFLPYLNPDMTVNMMTTATDGGTYLFGLFDTKVTKDVWVQLQGVVFHPILASSYQAIVGCYFGASIAGR